MRKLLRKEIVHKGKEIVVRAKRALLQVIALGHMHAHTLTT